jgi:hypothetical protein
MGKPWHSFMNKIKECLKLSENFRNGCIRLVYCVLKIVWFYYFTNPEEVWSRNYFKWRLMFLNNRNRKMIFLKPFFPFSTLHGSYSKQFVGSTPELKTNILRKSNSRLYLANRWCLKLIFYERLWFYYNFKSLKAFVSIYAFFIMTDGNNGMHLIWLNKKEIIVLLDHIN